MSQQDEDRLFVAGKARWLLEGGAQELDEEERALLLALADLESNTGGTVTKEERAALDALAARTSGYDPGEIARAVSHMVNAKAKHNTDLNWSELRKQRSQRE